MTPEHTPDLREAATAILRDLTRVPDAEFRDGQFEAIEALVAHRQRALVVQRTGWGKSAVYFVACRLRRSLHGAGPTLIVSPLLSLMRDQTEAAARAGVRTAAINSSNPTEWDDIIAELRSGDIDLLLVSPERLTNPAFREHVLPHLVADLGLLVIDEAHCISDWGHDFRPDYRRIRDLIADLPDGVPVLATTATANFRVIADIEEQLGVRLDGTSQQVFTVRGALARDSLRLGVLQLQTSRQRLGWLLAHLNELPGSGIIYALTISAAEDTARLLAEHGHAVRAYTGRTDPQDRERLEDDLKQNRVKALVATSALGMGFDKPDLGFVVHLGAPSSPVAYYQQVGRAGRATASADVLLLPGTEDRDIWRYFATASMPSQAKADAVLAALRDAPGPLSVPALETRVDLRRSPLELLLKVLAVDDAVEKVKGGWVATGKPWVYDAERYARIAAAREAEQRAMLEFERTDGCRMEFLTRQLDDPAAAPCGRCDNCLRAAGRPVWYATDVPTDWAETADEGLHRPGVEVEPRTSWPTGMDRLGVALKGRLKSTESVGSGRAISRLTDLGYGPALRELLTTDADGRPVDTELTPALARACIEVLSAWGWSTRPVAVAGIGSRSRPGLIRSTVEGLARVGRLTDLGDLEVAPDAPGIPARGNSAYRLAAVVDRFLVPAPMAQQLPSLAGPVLLVDDLIDSRWTMTVAGRALRRAGAAEVLPFALAVAG
ncbi:RecQ family ATP-dependent DNA helicase [Granulicoccus phenolivorans]|uniref:RecQ family ATP-dependent DNA helicase n=1 Tax=Granulicoccus phenolivorans TaxID=266854 RepID=UPI0004192539|nr:RecQ family ATP-dependent DNA helicase [Granulicoccus phenolivorans]